MKMLFLNFSQNDECCAIKAHDLVFCGNLGRDYQLIVKKTTPSLSRPLFGVIVISILNS